MAEYRDHYEDFQAAGFAVAALAVDEPIRSEALRRDLRLPFPILCDTEREVVSAWGLLNAAEKGGVARPAVLILDEDRRVLYSSRDSTHRRLRAGELVAFLCLGRVIAGARPPRRRILLAGLSDCWRALRSALRFGLTSPRT